jgi:hypothetical protein
MGLDEPIVGWDMAIAATCHWSTDLTALIAEFWFDIVPISSTI